MYVEFIFPVTELCMRKLTKGEAMQDIVGRIIFTGADQLCSSKMLADNYMQFYYQLVKDAKQRHLTIHNEHIRKFEEGLDSQKKKMLRYSSPHMCTLGTGEGQSRLSGSMAWTIRSHAKRRRLVLLVIHED